MVRTVERLGFEVHDWKAREHATLRRFANALLNGFVVLLRNRAADDLPLEDEAGARRLRLDANPNVAELTLAAGLPNEAAFFFDALGDRFCISNLRFADVGIDFELAP